MIDILVCGSLHLDVVVEAPRLPGLDETLPGTAWRYACGGKGGNQAVMAARLGARVAMMGRVGADDFGMRLLANLDAAGIERSSVCVDPVTGSGMSAAILDPAGDYGAVIVSGANLAIPPPEAAAAVAALRPKVLLLQNEVPEAVNLAAAVASKAAGATVILNAAPARKLGAELSAVLDVLVVNRVEAAMLSGHAVETVDEAVAALESLGATHRMVLVTLGGEGLVLGGPGLSPVAIAARKVPVVSTHGAGDAFIGALACKLSQGAALLAATQFANAAAAEFISGHDLV